MIKRFESLLKMLGINLRQTNFGCIFGLGIFELKKINNRINVV
jgi:hypothetical protein